jgi:N-acetylglutamate synthase-like GNAT family acetyltransferase
VEYTPFTARRATPEDLPALQDLWLRAELPAAELGQFIHEFQVVTDEAGTVVGAVGLLIEGDHALLHTEAIDPAVEADAVRATLWRRLQIVARNQGAKWLWTQEDAPYWPASGFSPAAAEAGKASFLDPTANWLCFQLVDPGRVQDALQEQFAILEASRLHEAEQFQQRVKLFRTVAYLLAFVVIAGCFILLFTIASKNPDVLRRLLGR